MQTVKDMLENELPEGRLRSALMERAKLGEERYGVLLTPFNGRNAWVDATEEVLDLVYYVRQMIEEGDWPEVEVWYHSLVLPLAQRIVEMDG